MHAGDVTVDALVHMSFWVKTARKKLGISSFSAARNNRHPSTQNPIGGKRIVVKTHNLKLALDSVERYRTFENHLSFYKILKN